MLGNLLGWRLDFPVGETVRKSPRQNVQRTDAAAAAQIVAYLHAQQVKTNMF
jgi:hypothetical protein